MTEEGQEIDEGNMIASDHGEEEHLGSIPNPSDGDYLEGKQARPRHEMYSSTPVFPSEREFATNGTQRGACFFGQGRCRGDVTGSTILFPKHRHELRAENDEWQRREETLRTEITATRRVKNVMAEQLVMLQERLARVSREKEEERKMFEASLTAIRADLREER